VAQKLHDTYGFSYDNLKVLLGGWHAWQDAGYPVAVTTPAAGAPTTAPGSSDQTAGTPVQLAPQAVPTKAP